MTSTPGMPESSAATIALFEPNQADPCASEVPYPIDLAKDMTTGTLAIPYCVGDPASLVEIKDGLRTLTGWALSSPIYVDFRGSVDPTTIDGAIYLLDRTHGGLITVQGAYDDTIGRLYIQPTTPLRESTTYVAVVTDKLLDATGIPAVSDQIFTFLKSTAPLIDDQLYSRFPSLTNDQANQLEPLRLLYQQLFTFAIEVAPLSLTRAEVLVAWSFTTQPVQSELEAVAASVAAYDPGVVTHLSGTPAATHPLLVAGGIPTAHLCRVHTGTASLTNILGANGMLLPDYDVAATPEAIEYLLITPNAAADAAVATTCLDAAGAADPWDFTKVAIFVHALGRCKNDALALADTLGQLGFATLSLDGPRAGSRTVGDLGDQNMDGCTDQPATPELLTLDPTDLNPFGVRDRMWEWGMEVMQVASLAKTGPWAFAGADGTGLPPTGDVIVFGHSFGGIAAVLATAVSSDVNLLAVNAASADFAAMFEPVVAGGIAAQLTAAGVDISTGAGQAEYEAQVAQAVSTFGWVLEPTDAGQAAAIFAGKAPQVPVLVQVVTSGNEALMPDAPLHDGSTQKELVSAFGTTLVANVTFDLACDDAGTVQPICDSNEGVLGALLQPCVSSATSPLYPIAFDRLVELRTQLATFIASSGAVIPAATAIVPCP